MSNNYSFLDNLYREVEVQNEIEQVVHDINDSQSTISDWSRHVTWTISRERDSSFSRSTLTGHPREITCSLSRTHHAKKERSRK